MIHITRSVAEYILEQACRLLADGWGYPDEFDEFNGGMIEEIPSDTEQYRYVNQVLHFIRYFAGIIRHALADAAEVSLLEDINSDDVSSI